MKKFFLFVVLSLSIGTAWASARSIRADVNGLVCSFCAAAIEKRLKALDATKAVYVDLTRKIVAVELKDGKDLAPEKIAEEIKDAGYDVVSIRRTGESIDEIRKSAKK